jgi:ribosome biogenesis GTPase
MEKLSKRQVQRIEHFFREKKERARCQSEKFRHRSSSGDGRRKESLVRLMAGNVDQIIIVASFVMPALKKGLIDRFLVVAGMERVEPVIVLNKADLLEARREGEEVLALYRSLGYTAFMTSTVTGEGTEVLKDQVRGRVSLLAGHSGVGKSSLLNAVGAGITERAEERAVSRATEKGVHTTTTIRLYQVDGKTILFDLPGVKLVSLYDLEPLEIQSHFPEFTAPSRECRYRDCLHMGERECGVKKSVEEGFIPQCRYESYQRMVLNPRAES